MKLRQLAPFVLIAISGCATSPDNIQSRYISPQRYSGMNCSSLVVENNHICRNIDRLYASLNKQVKKDKAKVAAAVVISPFVLLALDGKNSPQAIEYSRLKGELSALRAEASNKKCNLSKFTVPNTYLAKNNSKDTKESEAIHNDKV